jgi:hypothetical protein
LEHFGLLYSADLVKQQGLPEIGRDFNLEPPEYEAGVASYLT